MRKFFKWVGIPLASIVAIAWLYLQFAYPTYAVRYRLSVEVETPTGTKTGIGVLESVTESQVKFLPGVPAFVSEIRGEAIPIDLGNGQYLFVTLRRDSKRPGSYSAKGLASANLGASSKRFPKEQVRDYWIRANNSPLRHLKPSQLPLLVTFTDINDPASVQRVEPNDLPKYFGAGVQFGEIRLEITSKAITDGKIERVLDWWSNPPTKISSKFGPRSRYGGPLYAMGKWDFRRE